MPTTRFTPRFSLGAVFAVVTFCAFSFGALVNAGETLQLIVRGIFQCVMLVAAMIAVLSTERTQKVAAVVFLVPILFLLFEGYLLQFAIEPGRPMTRLLEVGWEGIRSKSDLEPSTTVDEDPFADPFAAVASYIPTKQCFLDLGIDLFSLFLAMSAGLFAYSFTAMPTNKSNDPASTHSLF